VSRRCFTTKSVAVRGEMSSISLNPTIALGVLCTCQRVQRYCQVCFLRNPRLTARIDVTQNLC